MLKDPAVSLPFREPSPGLSEAEQRLIDLVRGHLAQRFSLTIRRDTGRWTIVTSDKSDVDPTPRLAAGSTFEQAWASSWTSD